MEPFVGILLVILSGIITTIIAKRLGRSPVKSFLFAFSFPIIFFPLSSFLVIALNVILGSPVAVPYFLRKSGWDIFYAQCFFVPITFFLDWYSFETKSE